MDDRDVKANSIDVCDGATRRASEPGHYCGLFSAEVWRPVVGYEGLYEVSNHGRVRNPRSGRVLAQTINSDNGYVQISLSKAGRVLKPRLHIMVARAHLAPPTDGRDQVNHIDGVKTNCHASNLEWMTGPENMRHAAANGLMLRGEECKSSKLTEANVREVFVLRAGGMKHRDIARRMGTAHNAIHKILTGQTWAHLGLAPALAAAHRKPRGAKGGAG